MEELEENRIRAYWQKKVRQDPTACASYIAEVEIDLDRREAELTRRADFLLEREMHISSIIERINKMLTTDMSFFKEKV